jgi:hypothetical protein
VRDQVAATQSLISVEHIVQDAGTPELEHHAIAWGLRKEAGEWRMSAPHYCLRIIQEADSGMYDAVNRGLGKASGEICAYLNCDEQYLSGALALIAAEFRDRPRCEVLFADAIVVGPDGSYICDRQVSVPSRWHTLVSGNLSIFTASTFSRRKVFLEREILFSSELIAVGDAEWALRLLDNRAIYETRRDGAPPSEEILCWGLLSQSTLLRDLYTQVAESAGSF